MIARAKLEVILAVLAPRLAGGARTPDRRQRQREELHGTRLDKYALL